MQLYQHYIPGFTKIKSIPKKFTCIRSYFTGRAQGSEKNVKEKAQDQKFP